MKSFRFNIGLKVFALILFALEFLAPAFLAEYTPYENSPKKTQIANSNTYHNPLFSVFFEELCENEESKEFARSNSIQSPFILQNYSHLFESDLTISIASSASLLQCSRHPPFFLLHHRFLI